MRRFEVQITEMTREINAPVPPDATTPLVRDVYWTGDVADATAAMDAALATWDEKYGPNTRPEGSMQRVTQLDEGRS